MRTLVCFVVVLATQYPGSIVAQDVEGAPTPDEAIAAEPAAPDAASAHIDTGLTKLEQGRPADALREFEAALLLEPRAFTAYLAAECEHRLGRVRAAARRIEQIDRGTYGEVEARHAERIAEFSARVRADLAYLTVFVEGPEEAEVLIDGTRVGTSRMDEPMEVSIDPGEHRVRAESDAYLPAGRSLTIERGDRRELSLRLTERPVDEEISLARKPLFWVVLVGGVLLAAGAVGLVYGLTTEAAPTCSGPLCDVI